VTSVKRSAIAYSHKLAGAPGFWLYEIVVRFCKRHDITSVCLGFSAGVCRLQYSSKKELDKSCALRGLCVALMLPSQNTVLAPDRLGI